MQSTATHQPDVFNGLPLTEFGQIPVTLHEAPEQGILSFETRTTWLGGMRSRSRIDACEVGGQRIERHHVIDADEPPQILGTDTAPNPQELLLAAIGSCMSAIYAIHATMMGIELRSLEVELRGTLDLRGPLGLAEVPRGFPEVHCRVHVDAAATPAQLHALHAQALKMSPNYYHLTNAIPARTELVIK